jgi:hypothetical protein
MLITTITARGAPPAPNLARSILLTDAVESGARCLDGSPQRLWLQESPSRSERNRSKWVFHFMGGGECIGLDDCADRAYTPDQCYRGSSNVSCFNANSDREPGKPFNETMDFAHIPCINGARWGGGLLLNEPAVNPLTWDWNKVEMHYCDGNSYAGDNVTAARAPPSSPHAGKPLHFRGARNVEAALTYLRAHHGLGDATHVVLGGDSAGGTATFWRADYFASALPRAQVLAVPDSGFFISYAGCAPNASDPVARFNCTGPPSPWDNAARRAWYGGRAGINASAAGLDASCVAAHGADFAARCLLPEDVAPHVSTPLFVMNSRYDAAEELRPATPENVNARGEFQLGVLRRAVLAQPRNAAFITSCHEHCGQWAAGQTDSAAPGHADFNVTIGGVAAGSAVAAWARSRWHGTPLPFSQRVRVQRASYPCDSCCAGGDP